MDLINVAHAIDSFYHCSLVCNAHFLGVKTYFSVLNYDASIADMFSGNI